MNIIELEKEAGLQEVVEWYPDGTPKTIKQFPNDKLERFAALARAERELVDLTCEEVTALIREGAAGGGWQGFATRIQTAFKEKNK